MPALEFPKLRNCVKDQKQKTHPGRPVFEWDIVLQKVGLQTSVLGELGQIKCLSRLSGSLGRWSGTPATAGETERSHSWAMAEGAPQTPGPRSRAAVALKPLSVLLCPDPASTQ